MIKFLIYSSVILVGLASFQENDLNAGKMAIWSQHNSVTGDPNQSKNSVIVPSLSRASKCNPSYQSTTMDSKNIEELLSKHVSDEVVALFKSDNTKNIFQNNAVKSSISNANQVQIFPTIFHNNEDEQVTMESKIMNSNLMKASNEISLDEFHELFFHDDDKNILQNNKLDSFIVNLSGKDTDMKKLNDIMALSHSSRPITFMGFTESSPSLKMPVMMGNYHRILASESTSDSSSLYYKPEGSEYSIYYADTYLYITPDIFTGIMTGLFMFLVLYLGYQSLGSIQTPSSFATKNLMVGKEV